MSMSVFAREMTDVCILGLWIVCSWRGRQYDGGCACHQSVRGWVPVRGESSSSNGSSRGRVTIAAMCFFCCRVDAESWVVSLFVNVCREVIQCIVKNRAFSDTTAAVKVSVQQRCFGYIHHSREESRCNGPAETGNVSWASIIDLVCHVQPSWTFIQRQYA